MRTIDRHPLAALAGIVLPMALAAAGCAPVTPAPAPAPAVPPAQIAQIAQIVASPDRTAADRTNDQRRQPEKMLAFIGVRPGMAVLDVSTGGGYTAELLARAVGPGGQVYAQYQPRDPGRAPPAPAAPEGRAIPARRRRHPCRRPRLREPRPPPSPSASSIQGRAGAGGDHRRRRAALGRPVPPAVADAKLDLATLMFNYHDLGYLGVDRASMNRAIFRALRPGGLYVIADHAGRPGTGISESGTLHRIEEAFCARRSRRRIPPRRRRPVPAQSRDPRDRNTPDPPQPKDEFVLSSSSPERPIERMREHNRPIPRRAPLPCTSPPSNTRWSPRST